MEILLRLEGKFDFKDLASCCLLVPFYFPTLCSFFFLSDLSSLASSPLPFLVFLSLECLHQNYLTLSKYGWNQNFWSQGPRVCIFTSSPADSFVPEEIKSHWPKPTTTKTATAQSFPPPLSPRPGLLSSSSRISTLIGGEPFEIKGHFHISEEGITIVMAIRT